jgi:hypothetical protein
LMNDPAAGGGVSRETWTMDAARFAGPSYYMPSS